MNIRIHKHKSKAVLCCLSLIAGSYSLSAIADSYNYDANCEIIDGVVADSLSQLYSHSHYAGNYDADVIDKSNVVVDSLLKQYLSKPDSLTCQFKKAEDEGLMLLSSDDNKFRVYGWDLATGGTMHDYARLIQYQDAQGKLHLQDVKYDEEEPLHSFADGLFTITTKGSPLYLLVTNGVFSTMDRNASLTAFQIQGKTLTNPKVIKTGSGLTNRLDFSYNFFSLSKLRYSGELFEFDDAQQTIRFPVVVTDPKYPIGKVTSRKIVYHYDGQYFQRVKN